MIGGRRERRALSTGEEGGAVDDDLIDGGGDLGGDHIHLVLADESVVFDRFGEEALERVHSGADGGEVEKGDSRVGGGARRRVTEIVSGRPGWGLGCGGDVIKVAGVRHR